jgi:pSer/pThr/pTyr-binding forkhead associated (FHA) protein
MTVKLNVVQGRPAGKTVVLPPGEYFIGRGAECHIRPNSDWVSRQHCLLRVAVDTAFLKDLGSRNGTLVNGVLLIGGEQELRHGDQVQFGPLVFEVQYEDTPAPAAVEGLFDDETPREGRTAELPALKLPKPEAPETEAVSDRKRNSGR